MGRIQKATIKDVPQIHHLVNYYAEKGEMLPRALSEIYENIRDYFVLREDDHIVACAALHVTWADLAEVKSLAVTHGRQRQGIGAQLVKACLREVEEFGIPTVFCLTYQPEFFQTFGFCQIDKMELPRKVWTECYHCPKFPDCDEIAMIYHREEVKT